MIQLEERQSEACLICLIIVKDMVERGVINIDKMTEASINNVTLEDIGDTINVLTDLELLNKMEIVDNEDSDNKQES